MLNSTTLLVDFDYFLYRAAQANEIEEEFDEETTLIVGDLRGAQKMIKRNLQDLRQRFDTENLVLCTTAPNNFRKGVDEGYKSNRTKRKPAGYKRLKNWAKETWGLVEKPTLEADDVMGILATNGRLTDFVIVSPDKDMAQIPCRIYNLKTEYTQNEADAELKLYEQTLTGDTTDGYKGCPGIGPKRAMAILKKVEDGNYWPSVVATFIEAGQTEEDATRQFNMARILQAPNWDSENQCPILR